MQAFRVDKRLFAEGDEIRTASEYVGRFDRRRRFFEFVVDLLRPRRLRRRSEYTFVFESEEAARRYWVKMTDGKLYEVDVDEAEIGHRGDMALLETAFQSHKGIIRIRTIRRYWKGEMSNAPVVEITSRSAIVRRVISTSEDERRRCLVRTYNLVNGRSVFD